MEVIKKKMRSLKEKLEKAEAEAKEAEDELDATNEKADDVCLYFFCEELIVLTQCLKNNSVSQIFRKRSPFSNLIHPFPFLFLS